MFFPRIAFSALLALAILAAAPVEARTVSVAVVGDSLANDLANGMEDNFTGKPVNVIKLTQFATGLVRTDYFNWNGTVQNALRHGDGAVPPAGTGLAPHGPGPPGGLPSRGAGAVVPGCRAPGLAHGRPGAAAGGLRETPASRIVTLP